MSEVDPTGKTHLAMPAVRIVDDRADGPRTVEERLEVLERQGTLTLDTLGELIEHKNSRLARDKVRDARDSAIFDALAKINNSLTRTNLDTPSETERSLANLVVLVVEDDPHLLPAMRRGLHEAGATVFYARRALDAQMRLEKHGPRLFDAAVLDIRLPDSDGTALAHAIRRRAPECGIVLTSGYGVRDYEDSACQHKFTLLDKPFLTDELLDSVLACIQQIGAEGAPSLSQRLDARMQNR